MKIRFYLVNIILGVIIAIIVAVFLIIQFCKIENVSLTGTDLYTVEEMDGYVRNYKYSENSIYVVIHSLIKPVKDVPFIESVKVRFDGPAGIKIEAKEKEMLAVMAEENGLYVYFNTDGIVTDVSERFLEEKNLPGVTGVHCSDAVPGEMIPVEQNAANRLLTLTKNLAKYEIEANDYSFDQLSNLWMNHNGISVNFGTDELIAEKVIRLDAILPQIEGQTGTLHLENWTEQNTDVVFERVTN
ncbi:MAG: cell division protein FtsQ/DivIB [Lachnospiraceae bacterium]|nr:cell division protein FtsQ/DivIB [Lachnospiraceae bacterium]